MTALNATGQNRAHALGLSNHRRYFGLDVLRASAIAMVLLSHFSESFAGFYAARPPAWISVSGVLGVELFFVLSGYLIGGLLLEIAQQPLTARGWLTFMVRRWMRTVPLYVVCLVVVALVVLAPRHPVESFPRYLFFMQNFAWPMPKENWYGATWSLAVEEWFYLLFSIAALGYAALTRCKTISWLVIAAFIVMPFIFRWNSITDDFATSAYKTVLLRLDAIAYGVAFANLRKSGSEIFNHPVLTTIAALLLIVFTAGQIVEPWAVSFSTLMRWFPSVLSLGFALLLPGAVSMRETRGATGFVVAQLSALSYGIYLIHQPVVQYFEPEVHAGRLSPLIAMALTVGITVSLASISYRCFEQPILAMRPKQLTRRVQARKQPA